ncbi:glycosyltransferase [Bifidobacterium avesanii]|uniref:Glycosyltransferase n=1 Tax=Bifidobacterium avesanii TaxID=1798157 RepID=A0A7K3THU7_9BIFI|nr:glycosyltransferase [Bifidobacterium avesanii]KAB8291912.1 glycosyl transferase family 2 [Bifidobacterium avesanii]NEG78668.1 glycosyltransferase [Bifidobacterium avesanii]
MPKLSIIVPIYNTEAFLRQCLDSIKNQTFTDWECLLFSDGSKDHSIDIMKEFAAADDRFKVIEKQNEGYGATCNRGLNMATGEWVAIVEPDDFLDPNMYRRLLSRTSSPNGNLDIVKGAYWEYYDANGKYEEALLSPNLSNFMPKRRCEFSLEEFPAPFYHHPSIWSAVYRRAFLDGDNKNGMKIRFKEVPGAGWTDNPFFAQTMVLADRIAWMPGRYYYYRQTNPGASVFLKDYHLPFDRLREMREFLESQHVSKEIMRAFYSREFDYVTSVIGEFGYTDKGSDIRALIHEVFASMDRKEVFLMEGLRPEFLDYYMDFMGDSYDVHEHDAEEHPDLSIVLLMKDARSWIVDTLEAFTKYSKLKCEFIIADGGSSDSTMTVAREFAKKDHRFVIAGGPDDGDRSITSRARDAIGLARGAYTIFVPSNFIISEDMLVAACSGAEKANADVVLLDAGSVHYDYLAEKLIDRGVDPEYFIDRADREHGAMYGPFQAGELNDTALMFDWDYGWRKLFRTDFLRDKGIAAGPHDIADNMYEFGARALLAAQSLYVLDLKFDWGIDNTKRQRVGSAFWLSLVKNIPYTSQPQADIDSVLSTGEWLRETGAYGEYEKGYLNALLSSFMYGLRSRYTPEGIQAYLNAYKDKVSGMLDIKSRGALYFDDTDAFNDFQKITLGGSLDLWLEERALRDEDGLFDRDKRIRDYENSARLKAGTAIIAAAKKLSPSWFVAKAQEKAHMMKRTR